MPTWGEILKELKDHLEKEKKPPFDYVRRKYLAKLNEYTHRNTVLYASNWTQQKPIPSQLLGITDEDIQGFMEVISGLSSEGLDLIIHSPGGSAEATEALVIFLRSRFSHIRAIIPYGAMSAATMLACSADEIIMGEHSFIGPIDPQILIQSRYSMQLIPAQAIIEQFEMAKEECKDPKNLGVWLPIVEQYGPALIKQCEHARELAKELVATWLKSYMFKDDEKGEVKSKYIADQLSDHSYYKSHGRHIGITQAKTLLGLKISKLEDNQTLQDRVLSVFHATTHTFDATSTAKIIESNTGTAFVKQFKMISARVVPQKAKES